MTPEQAIGKDLELCDLIEALGTRAMKAKARAHRKACYEAIREMNSADGLDAMSVEDLLAELTA